MHACLRFHVIHTYLTDGDTIHTYTNFVSPSEKRHSKGVIHLIIVLFIHIQVDYVWQTALFANASFTPEEQRLSDQLHSLWLQFAAGKLTGTCDLSPILTLCV